MPDFPHLPIEVTGPPAPPEKSSDARRRWFEIALVLLVAVGGPLVNAVFLLHTGPGGAPRASSGRWLAGLVQEIAGLSLLGYVLSRRGLRFKNLGLRWSLSDLCIGLLLAVGALAAYIFGSLVVHFGHYAIQGSLGQGPSGKDFFAHPGLTAIPFALVNPFFEELIVRAYLMTEVRELTGSPTIAVFLSVVVQTSYHLYYGWTGALSMSFMFLALALYYSITRRALPVVVAHAVFDIYPLIRLW